MPRKLTNNDGDMTIQGTLTVLGGINEAQSLKVRTDLESTKQVVEVVQADVVAAQDTADTAVQRTFRYLGPLTSAPGTAGINDFYLDANTLALGGGVLRYYTGSTWEEATIAWPLYMMANWEALADMGEWATVQDEVIVAASAIFTKLTTANAFIGSLFAQQITVPAGGRIQYETGAGVQKRAVRLSDEKIDWLDVPDTSPASPELLRARIGRLGVGGTVLLDGDFEAGITTPWGAEIVINAPDVYTPNYIQPSWGELRIAYTRVSDGYLCERIWSGSAWGAETVINAAYSAFNTYIQFQNGELHIIYRRQSDFFIVERVWSGSAWGAETLLVSSNSWTSDIIELANGQRRICYINNANELAERIWTGSAFGAESVISTSINGYCKYIERFNGELRVCYQRASDLFSVERIWSGFSWGAETVINPAATYEMEYVQLVNNELRIAYVRTSDGFAVERIWTGSAWGSESVINASSSGSMAYIQTRDGMVHAAYRKASGSRLVERTLQRYAKLGAGIVEHDTDGSGNEYMDVGDGTRLYISTLLSAWGQFHKATATLFDTPGSATWTKPSGCKKVVIIAIGGGGGGGDGDSSLAGGGGGGGAFLKLSRSVDSISTIAITVGSAGAAGGATQSGGAGGSSIIGGFTVGGGSGGVRGGVGSGGGSGGVVSGSDVDYDVLESLSGGSGGNGSTVGGTGDDGGTGAITRGIAGINGAKNGNTLGPKMIWGFPCIGAITFQGGLGGTTSTGGGGGTGYGSGGGGGGESSNNGGVGVAGCVMFIESY